jgi:hypothetical protein
MVITDILETGKSIKKKNKSLEDRRKEEKRIGLRPITRIRSLKECNNRKKKNLLI